MTLHVVATPLGNLDDWSPRARTVVAAAALVLCEDTRVTRRLLSAVGIAAPRLVACHAHNEHEAWSAARAALERGEDVVYMSDAGTPAVSDPGARLVQEAHGAGFAVRALPGPSAAVAAWSVSGFQGPMTVLGFPPRKAGARLAWLIAEGAREGGLVLFEAGRRTPELVASVAEAFGPTQRVGLARELTKLHEEVWVGEVGALSQRQEFLGEVTLVVGPREDSARARSKSETAGPADDSLGALAEALARRWGTTRREAYNALLELERARGQEDASS